MTLQDPAMTGGGEAELQALSLILRDALLSFDVA